MTDTTESLRRAPPFVETKEYRRFAEFCDACCQYRYIGLCFGPPGVGKTLSARHYARWEELEPVLTKHRYAIEPPAHPEFADCRTVVYTPSMTTTPKRLDGELHQLSFSLHVTVEAAHHAGEDDPEFVSYDDRWTELVIVDEADRLKFPTLEQLRDVTEVHRPVKDFTAPSTEQLRQGVAAIERAGAEGKRVAVHCGGGLGRTGTLLACYLVSAAGLVGLLVWPLVRGGA